MFRDILRRFFGRPYGERVLAARTTSRVLTSERLVRIGREGDAAIRALRADIGLTDPREGTLMLIDGHPVRRFISREEVDAGLDRLRHL